MLLIVSQGLFRVAVMMLIVMMRMMMPRMHLGYIVAGGRHLRVLAVSYLTPVMLLLLGLWVHPYFRWFLTALISYKFRTRRSYATNRTWPTWFSMLLVPLVAIPTS